LTQNPQVNRSVLSVGTIPELLSLRAALLQSVGYTVFTASSPQEALAKLRSGGCGVLLLCYSVDDPWREKLIQVFREIRPEGRIVGISNHPVTQFPQDVNEVVLGIEGPEALIDAVKRNAA
jgi:CheY-like chemotaxis protein